MHSAFCPNMKVWIKTRSKLHTHSMIPRLGYNGRIGHRTSVCESIRTICKVVCDWLVVYLKHNSYHHNIFLYTFSTLLSQSNCGLPLNGTGNRISLHRCITRRSRHARSVYGRSTRGGRSRSSGSTWRARRFSCSYTGLRCMRRSLRRSCDY